MLKIMNGTKEMLNINDDGSLNIIDETLKLEAEDIMKEQTKNIEHTIDINRLKKISG